MPQNENKLTREKYKVLIFAAWLYRLQPVIKGITSIFECKIFHLSITCKIPSEWSYLILLISYLIFLISVICWNRQERWMPFLWFLLQDLLWSTSFGLFILFYSYNINYCCHAANAKVVIHVISNIFLITGHLLDPESSCVEHCPCTEGSTGAYKGLYNF